VTEGLLFLLIVGNYGLGLRRDGLPFARLVGAATVVYWGLRLGGGGLFVTLGHALGRQPQLMSEATMTLVAPFAALCAYAAVRLLERRVLESAARAPAPDEEAPERAADPFPLLPAPGRTPRARLSHREEWLLMGAIAVAGAVMYVHGVATARPFWRDDLDAAGRAELRRRAEEALRLEGRLLDCQRPPAARDREAYRRLLAESARAGLLRVGSRPESAAQVLANLERERADRCGAALTNLRSK
jgi:hypothetical protein